MDRDIHIPVSPNGYVRILHTEDVGADYINALNDRELTSFMMPSDHEYTHADIVQYVVDNLADTRALLFGVFDDQHRLIGTSRVHDISPDDQSCWMGVFLFRTELMGKGRGSGVVRAVSDFALQSCGVSRVQAGIYTINEASRACFRKAGFVLAQDGLEYNGQSREIWERRKSHG